MGKPLNIVCIAQPAWDGEYAKSTVLLMKELARNNRVLYVDYAYTWKDFFNTLLGIQKAPIKRMLGLENRLRDIQESTFGFLYVLTLPPVIPINFLPTGKLYDFFSRWNTGLIARFIKRAMQCLDMCKPVVINAFSPALGRQLKGKLNELLTIYYNYDDIHSAQWTNKHGSKTESEFSQLADVVVVTSDQLNKDRSHLNKKTITIKNGVDFELFDKAIARGNWQGNSKPVVGFVGSLDSRIDFTLLSETVKLLPHFQFRFVGRIVDDRFYELLDFKNTEWVKPVPYEQLPEIIRGFDVGLIPFVKSTFTEKIYPLKINEYLAAGKPVVMTSFAAFPEFKNVVLVADHPETFADAIQYANYSTSAEAAQERRKIARQNSWKARASQFQDLIIRELHGKEF